MRRSFGWQSSTVAPSPGLEGTDLLPPPTRLPRLPSTLECRALPGNRRTLACDESGVMARLGASGDQWAVPRAQSRSTEPYWEPVELEEEGVARGGVVVVVLVSREIAFSKHQLGPQTC